MQTSLTRREVILFKVSFAIGMIFLFLAVFGQGSLLRILAWASLILACLYPIRRTITFRRNRYIQLVTAINFVIILLIALNPSQMWRLGLAGAIVTVSMIHHVILTFDAMGNIRKQTRAETIAEIDAAAARHMGANGTTDPPAP